MDNNVKRKRSFSALPIVHKLPGKNADSGRARFYSVSSQIVPQTIQVTDDLGRKAAATEPKSSSPAFADLSKVGFQSIYRDPTVKKSQRSINTPEPSAKLHATSSSSSIKSSTMTSNRSYRSGSNTSGLSHKRSALSLSNKLSGKKSVDTFDREKRKINGVDGSSSSISSSNKERSRLFTNTLTSAARKLFHRKDGRQEKRGEQLKSPTAVTSSTFGRFLHNKYSKHVGKATAHYKYSSGSFIDSAKSNANNPSTSNDVPLQLVQESNLDASDIQMLHDLIKNLKSLESNYRTFTVEELDALMSNVWGVYCSVVLTLFKNRELWELPAKIEDLNKILSFYIKLKTTSKNASASSKFLSEIEEFLATCLYTLENQIVFNYSNENTINTALKRLCVIWEVFYQQIYHSAIALFLPLSNSFLVDTRYWSETFNGFSSDGIGNKRAGSLSLDFLLLKSFRDSIVSPYYQSFINSHEGASKGFHLYIMSEEEEKGVTQQDKLVLLQCFGILSSIRGTDIKQRVVDELLVGIRMSI